MLDVGGRIRELRLEKKVTSTQLAQHLGVAQSFISAIENGTKKVSLENLNKICGFLNIDISHFFSSSSPVDMPEDIHKFSLNHKNQALIRMIQGMLNSGYSAEAIGEWLDSFTRQAKQIEKAILEKYSLQDLREKGAYSGADPTPEEQEQLNSFMKKYKEGNAFPFQTEK